MAIASLRHGLEEQTDQLLSSPRDDPNAPQRQQEESIIFLNQMLTARRDNLLENCWKTNVKKA
jgi:hypothetical protein